MTEATTLSAPFYKVRPPNLPESLPAVQMMAVDILPTSIPLDASESFSKSLMPYLTAAIDNQVESTWDVEPKTPMAEALKRATIAEHGKLINGHKWLWPVVKHFHGKNEPRKVEEVQNEDATKSEDVLEGTTSAVIDHKEMLSPATQEKTRSSRKKILILGSGMVAQPAVDMIATRPDVDLVIGAYFNFRFLAHGS